MSYWMLENNHRFQHSVDLVRDFCGFNLCENGFWFCIFKFETFPMCIVSFVCTISFFYRNAHTLTHILLNVIRTALIHSGLTQTEYSNERFDGFDSVQSSRCAFGWVYDSSKIGSLAYVYVNHVNVRSLLITLITLHFFL